MEKTTPKRGFTLIELLIVIAILGVLASAVVVVLNPAELLAEARDSQRMSDLNNVSTGLNLFLSQVGATSSASMDYSTYGPGGGCSYINSTSTQPFNYTNGTGGTAPYASSSQASTTRLINGTGWADVNFAAIPGGAPFSVLPIDPTNGSNYYTYCYVGTSTPTYSYKLATRMESVKFASKEIQWDASTSTTACGGSGPAATNQYCWYQVGTNLGL
ncbi:prepilin-type N-terminal cleavage/methylation domain-containing protein [Patescibacteria group bacterium]|nr:prepilin-type N-terminal cleavage/methylation domain-containing protein [Patescibacteria group bacterium]